MSSIGAAHNEGIPSNDISSITNESISTCEATKGLTINQEETASKVFLDWKCTSPNHGLGSSTSSEDTSDSGQVQDLSPVLSNEFQTTGGGHLIERNSVSADGGLCLYRMPIVGYEVLEERSRFTIFKIQVIHISSGSKWFVFRRYTDFVRLNKKLKNEFPGFRFALPPKRWFGNNFDPIFIEDRQIGLQTFINNVIAHSNICNSKYVRSFFCLDNPPSPHESLEESMALCHCLEQTVAELQNCLHEKDTEIVVLNARIELILTQHEALVKALRLECDLKEDNPTKSVKSKSDLNFALLDICERTLRDQVNHPMAHSTDDEGSKECERLRRKTSLLGQDRRTLGRVVLSPATPLSSKALPQ